MFCKICPNNENCIYKGKQLSAACGFKKWKENIVYISMSDLYVSNQFSGMVCWIFMVLNAKQLCNAQYISCDRWSEYEYLMPFPDGFVCKYSFSSSVKGNLGDRKADICMS